MPVHSGSPISRSVNTKWPSWRAIGFVLGFDALRGKQWSERVGMARCRLLGEATLAFNPLQNFCNILTRRKRRLEYAVDNKGVASKQKTKDSQNDLRNLQ